MVNYRVDDLLALDLRRSKRRAATCSTRSDESDYGKFGWVIDPEGNKVELWQPPVGQ